MLLDRRPFQQANGWEVDHEFGLAMEQVQQDRHGGRGRGDQEQRREEGDAEHHNTRRRVIKYALSPSSSGCEVSSRQ